MSNEQKDIEYKKKQELYRYRNEKNRHRVIINNYYYEYNKPSFHDIEKLLGGNDYGLLF
jgi:hypothetical protein